jgi:hypothetical protein
VTGTYQLPAEAVIVLSGSARPWPPEADGHGVLPVDALTLPDIDLSPVSGIIVSGGVDQVSLAEHREILDSFVTSGGRILVNGHVQVPFLSGLGTWRKLEFHGPADLVLTRVTDHPVWRGADLERLLYMMGGTDGISATGDLPSLDELRRHGVAGFYGRGYLSPLPVDAVVVNGIGPWQAPVDVEYPLGRGRVLVHSGNDLQMFMRPARGTAHMWDQLTDWLRDRDGQTAGQIPGQAPGQIPGQVPGCVTDTRKDSE